MNMTHPNILQAERTGYREFPRKPRPLAARMNWKNKFKIT